MSVNPGLLTASQNGTTVRRRDLLRALQELDAKVRYLETMPMIRVSRRALAPRDPRMAAKLETLLLTLFPHTAFRQDPTSWRDEGTRWNVGAWSFKKQRRVYRQAIRARKQWVRWKALAISARIALSLPMAQTPERLYLLEQKTEELIADLKQSLGKKRKHKERVR
jgi:hypothetical protein